MAKTTKTATKPKAPKRSREELAQQSSAARAAAWSSWGALDGDVIAHAINPAFTGAPRWPGLRQAYRVARREGIVLIGSDGLSDPYDQGHGSPNQNGLGLEVFAATDEVLAAPGDTSTTAVAGSWLFDIVYQVSQVAAAHGELAALLDKLGLLSLEVWDVAIPASHRERFFNEDDRVCILLSAGANPIPTRVAGPLGTIRFMHAQLLLRDELEYLLEHGDEGRRTLADRLIAQGTAPLSRLDRPSVV